MLYRLGVASHYGMSGQALLESETVYTTEALAALITETATEIVNEGGRRFALDDDLLGSVKARLVERGTFRVPATVDVVFEHGRRLQLR